MTAAFNTIGLMGRYREYGEEVLPTIKALKQCLTQLGVEITLEEQTAKELNDTQFPAIPAQQLGAHCDLIIVVGGDGSLLNAARCANPFDKPVLGINRGRLGFLTDIHPDELDDKVRAVIAGEYYEENRFLLSSSVHTQGSVIELNQALNDVVLMPGDIPHMIEYEITIDGEFVCKQRADGIIMATPTGSTAYALSGGGPILHPQLDAIVLVPMFPFTLSSRPIVISGECTIELYITPNNECSPRISCDGNKRVTIAPESVVKIKKHHQQLRLIHPKDYNYFETLRTKLGWEKHV